MESSWHLRRWWSSHLAVGHLVEDLVPTADVRFAFFWRLRIFSVFCIVGELVIVAPAERRFVHHRLKKLVGYFRSSGADHHVGVNKLIGKKQNTANIS